MSRARVIEIVTRVWPDADPQAVMAVLDEYGMEGSERGRASKKGEHGHTDGSDGTAGPAGV